MNRRGFFQVVGGAIAGVLGLGHTKAKADSNNDKFIGSLAELKNIRPQLLLGGGYYSLFYTGRIGENAADEIWRGIAEVVFRHHAEVWAITVGSRIWEHLAANKEIEHKPTMYISTYKNRGKTNCRFANIPINKGETFNPSGCVAAWDRQMYGIELRCCSNVNRIMRLRK